MKQYQAITMMILLAVIAGVLIYSNVKKDDPSADTTPVTVPEKE